MKNLYSSVTAIVAFFVFAGVAAAGPTSWDKIIVKGRFQVLNAFGVELAVQLRSQMK